MKKSVRICGILKTKLHSKQFVNDFKMSSQAFLRCRLLPFPLLFLFILNLLRKSIPKELNSFCNNLNLERTSRSAITQARAKISAQAFVKLNDILVDEFYKDNDFKTFKDFILVAIDGSTLQLPNSCAIVEKYGYISNNTEEKMPASRISFLYDVLNNVILNAQLCPYKSDEREMAIQHIEALKSLDIDLKRLLLIFDRGYPSLALMYYLSQNGINFVIRSGTGFLKEVNDVLKSNKKDEIIRISPKRLKEISKAKAAISKLFPCLNLKDDIIFRVLIIELQTGEKEILLTSLLCQKTFPHNMFKDLYFKRWGIEEGYKFIKVIEIENFSGKSILAVEQDFHATILVANFHALLALEAQEELKNSCSYLKDSNPFTIVFREDSSPHVQNTKYEYHVNKRVSIEGLKNKFVGVLLDSQSDVEAFCVGIKKIMKQDLIPKRFERSSKRVQTYTRRKYHMNQR